jgi:hypothetical protein
MQSLAQLLAIAKEATHDAYDHDSTFQNVSHIDALSCRHMQNSEGTKQGHKSQASMMDSM